MKTIIGLEIHVQLKTKSKMFCRCDNEASGKAPNSVVCPICMGFPGVLPKPNKLAIQWAIKTALALGCKIQPEFKFDRKHYFYPDLPKNYQISQYDRPLSRNGFFELDGKKIRIRRVHLEEDAGKLLHPRGVNYSLVDLNRAGTPLMEIVTEPDISTPLEAKKFMQELRLILRYLDVSWADMEKGHLRCDANISITQIQKSKIKNQNLGIPVEIKNMNSFKMVERALKYEEKRQKELIENGEKVVKETRGWNDAKGITIQQRTKEYAHDYRYFPEPDIPPFRIEMRDEKRRRGVEKIEGFDLEKIKAEIPKLPTERRKELNEKYKLKKEEIEALISSRKKVEYFQKIAQSASPQKAANWMVHEKLGIKIEEEKFIELLQKIEKGEISGLMGKQISQIMVESGKDVGEVMKQLGIKQIKDTEKLEKIIKKVLSSNPKALDDLKKGKEAALGFLVGQVMRETKGQANPQMVNNLLKERLKK